MNIMELFRYIEASIVQQNTLMTELIDSLPVNIYWKDNMGHYLGRNQYAAQKMVAQNFESTLAKDFIIGKTDHCLFDKKTASKFRKHDKEVIKSGGVCQMIESLILPTQEIIQQLSTKKVIKVSKRNEYVIGCTINMLDFSFDPAHPKKNDNRFKQDVIYFMCNPSPMRTTMIANHLHDLAKLSTANPLLKKIALLSRRELECLCLIARGYSSKEIGSLLKVSYRTVEVFIEHIKLKLNFSYKSQLSALFWKLLASL